MFYVKSALSGVGSFYCTQAHCFRYGRSTFWKRCALFDPPNSLLLTRLNEACRSIYLLIRDCCQRK
jgi:hypothetical protein